MVGEERSGGADAQGLDGYFKDVCSLLRTEEGLSSEESRSNSCSKIFPLPAGRFNNRAGKGDE